MIRVLVGLYSVIFAAGPCLADQIEGCLLGYTGGNRRGTYRILTTAGSVLVDKNEDTVVDRAVLERRLFNGAMIEVVVRPCEPDECQGEANSRRGVARNIRFAEKQRTELNAGFKAINTWLDHLWAGEPAAHDAVLSERCQKDPGTEKVVRELVFEKSQKISRMNLGIGAWTFARLGKRDAEAILDPTLFAGHTSLRLTVVFDGDVVLIDRLALEKPEAFPRLFGFE